MVDGEQGTLRATECMADIEGLATWAVRGKSIWRPAEPEAQGVLKACLYKVNPYLAKGMTVSQ